MSTEPETMPCHISTYEQAACPCDGPATIRLVVKHHHVKTTDSCDELVVAMCEHHYGHYLMALMRMVVNGQLSDGGTCSRCGRVIENGTDVFERIDN